MEEHNILADIKGVLPVSLVGDEGDTRVGGCSERWGRVYLCEAVSDNNSYVCIVGESPCVTWKELLAAIKAAASAPNASVRYSET